MMNSKLLRQISSKALLVAAVAALGACGPVNRSLDSVHQPTVQRTDYVYDLPTGTLSATDEQRLAAWFDALQLGYGDRVAIDDRSGYGASQQAIASILGRYGLLLSPTAPVTEGSADSSGVRVVVSRSTASVAGCPDWRRKSNPEFAASTMSNYGCAVNSNIAAMVANPDDLVAGQPGSGTDSRTITRAIKTYRDAEPTGKGELKQESSSKSSGGK